MVLECGLVNLSYDSIAKEEKEGRTGLFKMVEEEHKDCLTS